MTTILLTGIPKVGKSELAETTKILSQKYYGKEVDSFSLASFVAEQARHFWNTPPERVCKLDPEVQKPLRKAAISYAALELRKKNPEKHVIVNTPLTIYVHNGYVPDIVFNADDIAELHRARGFDYVVTLIDDPNVVAKKLQDTPNPADIGTLLHWMAMEVNVTKSMYHQKPCGNEIIVPKRHLVIPKNYSDSTLVKLLNDPTPSVVYLAGPITALKIHANDSDEVQQQKQEARKKIELFRQQLQEYAIVIAPMELADMGVRKIEKEHTVFRDIHWFAADADITLAYFPDDCHSAGVGEEIRATLRTGKPVILIHPSQDTDIFGLQPSLHFKNKEDFFSAVTQARDNPKYELLIRFLNPRENVARYRRF